MKIFDELDNILTDPDLTKGWLHEDKRPITHRYKITQEEEGHYEVVAEYPNGGKDVAWVIDVPEEGHWVAYDEDDNEIESDKFIPDDAPHEVDIPGFQPFLRFVQYTAEELEEIAKAKYQEKIDALKNKLSETDYISAKMSDSIMGCSDTADILSVITSHQAEYSDVLEQRQEWRDEINRLETENPNYEDLLNEVTGEEFISMIEEVL